MGLFSSDTITDFVRRGDLDGVRRRLEKGDDVNERRSLNTTPLLEAAQFGYWVIVELLLDHGADMELVHYNRYTALHMAIDYKKSGGGADTNATWGVCQQDRISWSNASPMCNPEEFLTGYEGASSPWADPMIRCTSGKIAKDYILYCREGFENLLNAYTDLDGAISLRNASAIAACLTGDIAVTISSIEAALQRKHTKAVTVILEMTLANETLETNILHHNVVQAAIAKTPDTGFCEALVHIAESYWNDLLGKVLRSKEIEKLKTLVQGIRNRAWIHGTRFSNGWTALHLAASLDNEAFVRYLLVYCGLNSLVASTDEKIARDVAILANPNSKSCDLLREHTKKMMFYDQTALLERSDCG